MKNKRIIMLFVFFTFIFLGMNELDASVWECKYEFTITEEVEEIVEPRLSYVGEKINFTFSVDSGTGFIEKYKIESACSGTIELPVSNERLGAEYICNLVVYNDFDALDGLNKNAKDNSTGKYVCPQSLGFRASDYGLELTTSYAEFGMSSKGTKCISDCTGTTQPQIQECPEFVMTGKSNQGCYKVKYVYNSQNVWQPDVWKFKNTDSCNGAETKLSLSYYESDNSWRTSSMQNVNVKLPSVKNCDEVKNIKTISEADYDPNGKWTEIIQAGETSNLVIKPGEKLSCSEIIGENGKTLVKIGILVVRIITPILLFIFTALEFMKAIPQQDEDAIIKAWKRFGTRGVITAIIMLLPTFLNILGMLTGVFDNCDIW